MNTKPTANASYHEWIDYYNKMLVGQIKPELDIAWQKRLRKIFSEMPENWCLKTDTEILRGKGIVWDRESGNFFFKPRPVDWQQFMEHECHPKLRPLAEWCVAAITQLEGMDEAPAIAGLLENAIEKINSLDLAGAVDLLLGRRTLKEKFIFAAAAAIKKKTRLKVPVNRHGIDANSVKSFLCEVFLKHQLLDYKFHIVRQRQLRRMRHPLLGIYLSHEQGQRQLEIVHATQYIFAIATAHDSTINVFSALRFLNEETLTVKHGGEVKKLIYYHCAMIREDKIDDAGSVAAFKSQVEGIISIANQVSTAIMELQENMEDHYDTRIRPALFRPLESYNVSLAQAIAQKLHSHEKALQQGILEPMLRGIRRAASHAEDFKYLFVGVRQLMNEITADFASFQLQPVVQGDPAAERMMMRLQAYSKLIIKRSRKIFSKAAVDDWQANAAAAIAPVEGLRAVIEKFNDTYAAAKENIATLEKQLESDESFFDRLLRRRQRLEQNLVRAQTEAKKIQRAAFLEINSLFGQYANETVYLEHKSMLFMTSQRSYAVCAGDNGVSELPVLVTLPENYNDFDPSIYAGLLDERREDWQHQDTRQDSYHRSVTKAGRAH